MFLVVGQSILPIPKVQTKESGQGKGPNHHVQEGHSSHDKFRSPVHVVVFVAVAAASGRRHVALVVLVVAVVVASRLIFLLVVCIVRRYSSTFVSASFLLDGMMGFVAVRFAASQPFRIN